MTKRILGLCCFALSTIAATAANAQSPNKKVNPKDQQQYVWIAPGKFTMGCSPADARCTSDETPAHTVEITKGFFMGETPVTVAAWKRYRTAANKPALPVADEYGRRLNEAAGDDNLPVVQATWDDAGNYCSWASLRLPTEAEWEFAARAGVAGASYGWLNTVAWYGDNSGKKPVDSNDMYRSDQWNYPKKLFKNENGPHPVKTKEANAWGLYDMLGNVWEWTADYYASDYYSNSPAQNPTGPSAGTQRVLRGGAWSAVQNNVRVSYRLTNPPGDRVNAFGFRCAGDLP